MNSLTKFITVCKCSGGGRGWNLLDVQICWSSRWSCDEQTASQRFSQCCFILMNTTPTTTTTPRQIMWLHTPSSAVGVLTVCVSVCVCYCVFLCVFAELFGALPATRVAVFARACHVVRGPPNGEINYRQCHLSWHRSQFDHVSQMKGALW